MHIQKGGRKMKTQNMRAGKIGVGARDVLAVSLVLTVLTMIAVYLGVI
jgi:hypothetical protein